MAEVHKQAVSNVSISGEASFPGGQKAALLCPYICLLAQFWLLLWAQEEQGVWCLLPFLYGHQFDWIRTRPYDTFEP